MTSMPLSPPFEVPQYRGKTLTPESPRPLHISTPSNVPVLENQIDPVFNLMSTHMEPPYPLQNLTALDHEMAHSLTNQSPQPSSETNENGMGGGMQPQNGYHDVNEDEGQARPLGREEIEAEEELSHSSLVPIQSPLLANQQTTSLASYDHIQTPTQVNLDENHTNLPSSKNASLHVAESYIPFQDTTFTDDQYELRPENTQTEEAQTEGVVTGGVNYQALLDTLSPSSATPPSTNDVPPVNLALSSDTTDVLMPHGDNPTSATTAAPAGLPPRPPPQEKPAIHPNYVPGEDIRSYHYPHIHHANHPPPQPSNSYRPSQNFAHPVIAAGAPGTSSAPNGLPPPPLATFQQSSGSVDQVPHSPSTQQFRQTEGPGKAGNGTVQSTETRDDEDWGEEIEQKFNQFLSDEKVYTAEGTWDKFPHGSRLFVGNLPSEVVTKRDIFKIFHKYGKLAQISIKQAYGFVQFLDNSACRTALEGEQGKRIKERNMNLEISKPQKNSRNAASSAAGDTLRASYYRHSRSPDHGHRLSQHLPSQRPGTDRFIPSFSDFRDEPRRRDDYRPVRSPSPRNYRVRDEYRGRDRSPDRYYPGRRSRSRSPYSRAPVRYRSPSPRRRDFDEDAALPIPRRNPRDVPDVQLILIDQLDRAFIAYVENSFRNRGLRVDVLLLPNVPLAAVIKRQILEGVQAVVKLFRTAQLSGKIPLQLFDRTGGIDNVRFEEYDELEARIAAELVVRAKSMQSAPMPAHSQYPAAPPPYGGPQYNETFRQPPPPQQQPVPAGGPGDVANIIGSLDTPALQQLLAAMQQNPQGLQAMPHQAPIHGIPQQPNVQNQDLAALLANAGRQQGPPQQVPIPPGYPYPPNSNQPQPQAPPQYPYGASFQPSQQIPHQQQQPSGQQQQRHVQDIMEQLAKWQR